MVAILKIYIELLLLNQKANLLETCGNQVSDTGPSWPSCFICFPRFEPTRGFFHTHLLSKCIDSRYLVDLVNFSGF